MYQNSARDSFNLVVAIRQLAVQPLLQRDHDWQRGAPRLEDIPNLLIHS